MSEIVIKKQAEVENKAMSTELADSELEAVAGGGDQTNSQTLCLGLAAGALTSNINVDLL